MMNLKTDSAIFNLYKPPGISSYDVIRNLKKVLPERPKKIGHFGTLDPFAEGVLLIGINRAPRLNEYIHSLCPKTYLASGILGRKTSTGDLSSQEIEVDESSEFLQEVSKLSLGYIEKELRDKFLGEYWQEPHQFSASKFEGKKMYEYAREGIEVKKEAKKREVYDLRVKDFSFPNLNIEFKVSSGTYIRTLFLDCAKHLGTIGVLEKLNRTQIGSISSVKDQNVDNFMQNEVSFQDMLPFASLDFSHEDILRFRNGNFVRVSSKNHVIGDIFWAISESGRIESMIKVDDEQMFRPVINF